MAEFKQRLITLLNQQCAENESDTPDFILAEYLLDCLTAFDKATVSRDKWYSCGGVKIATLSNNLQQKEEINNET